MKSVAEQLELILRCAPTLSNEWGGVNMNSGGEGLDIVAVGVISGYVVTK